MLLYWGVAKFTSSGLPLRKDTTENILVTMLALFFPTANFNETPLVFNWMSQFLCHHLSFLQSSPCFHLPSVSSVVLFFFFFSCLQSPWSLPLSCGLRTLSKRFTLIRGSWSYISKPNSECCCGRRKSSRWFLNTYKWHNGSQKVVRGAAEVVE